MRQSHPPSHNNTPPKILNKNVIHRLHNHHLNYIEMQQQKQSFHHPNEIIPEEGKTKIKDTPNRIKCI